MAPDEEGVNDAAEHRLLSNFVDFLMPLLRPYEATLYLFLLRRTRLVGLPSTRVGLRTISKECGIGARSQSGGNQQHIREVLTALEAKGCISIGDRTREGTLYAVRLPDEIDGSKERMALVSPEAPKDYYRDTELRRLLFERDGWRCHYCGEPITEENATLDHLAPASKGGPDTAENLVAACLLCNSLKSGKSYDEAAPLILASVRDRQAQNPLP